MVYLYVHLQAIILFKFQYSIEIQYSRLFIAFQIEALECLSSSVSMFSSEPKNASDNSEPKVLNEILRPSSSSSNWISGDVALHTLSHAKYGFAMQCITNLLMEHPSWPENITSLSETQQYNTLLSTFENKLSAGISYFEQKYSLISHHLINMVLTY